MPYNFETTFTQPLLLKIDSGELAGPDGFADAITKAYITTIKAGLPQGVVPSLPAPGLNPIAPPPFPIGPTGFTTADSRSKFFYNTVYAYYLAKEMSLDKAAVDNLTKMIKALIRKIKDTQQQIRTIIDEIKLLYEELKQLPDLIKEIVQEIKAEVKRTIEDLKLTVGNLFEPIKLEIGEEQFKAVFVKELAIYDLFKNFDITNLDNVQMLLLYVKEQTDSLERQFQVRTPAESLKKYVRDRLLAAADQILGLASGLTDPSKILDLVRIAVKSKARLTALWNKLQRFDAFVRYIQPKLRKLEIKKNDKTKELKMLLQAKLNDLKAKLEKKIAEYASKRKQSKKVQIFSKAKKKVDAFKKKNEAKIKKTKRNIELSSKAFKSGLNLFEKSLNLKKRLEGEFDQIKTDIENFKQSLQSVRNAAQQVATAAGNISLSPGITPKVLEVDQAIIKDKELALLRNYLNSINLSAFAEVAAGVLLQTKASFDLFKRFFEKRSQRWPVYIIEIYEIEKEIKILRETLKLLKDENYKPKDIQARTLVKTKKGKSLKEVIDALLKIIRPKIKKIVENIKEFINKEKQELLIKLTKFQEDIEVFALSLAPVSSNVEDVKNKKQVAEAKKRRIEELRKAISKNIKLSKAVYKMARGFIGFTESLIIKGEYKLGANQNNVDLIVDNYYLIEMEDEPPHVQTILQYEKNNVKQGFKALLVIEGLIYSLIETFKDISKTDFVKDFKELTKELEPQSVQTLLKFFESPPQTPGQIKEAMNALTGAILNDVRLVNVILALEQKYLTKSRRVVEQLAAMKGLEGTRYMATLKKVKDSLDKNKSFIILAFQLLKKELIKFSAFVIKKIKEVIEKVKKKLSTFIEKKKTQAEEKIKTDNSRAALHKLDMAAASALFGLAARLFWTGATWVGSSGSTHLVFNIGLFTKIEANIEDGASGLIKGMAKGFEAQLTAMSGLITPPANTGIPPIPFSGYK